MRCPNCAGEIPAGSRFCGICGRNITVAPAPVAQVLGDASAGGQWQAETVARRPDEEPAMSLFELPVSRGARTAKMALVLVLDAILAGAGIIMILSYLDARRAPEPVKRPSPARGSVQVGAPKAVVPTAPAAQKNAQPETKKPEAARRGEQPKRQPAAAPLARPTATRPPPPAPGTPDSLGADEPVAEAAAGESDGGEEVDEVSAGLHQVVQRHAGDLERCYQRSAKLSGPGDPLEGRIDVHVTVMPDGSARDVHAGENTTGSAQLADCAVSLFRTFALPAGAAAPIQLVWPLQFRPPPT